MWGVTRKNEISPTSSGELSELKQAVQKAETSTLVSLDLLRQRRFQPAMVLRKKKMIKKLGEVNELLNLEQIRVVKKEVEPNRHDANNKAFIQLLELASDLATDDKTIKSMLKKLSDGIE